VSDGCWFEERPLVHALRQVRMSWCVMQERVYAMQSDVEVLFHRTGGRSVNNVEPDPFITMAELQVLDACRHAPFYNSVYRVAQKK